MPKSVLAWKHGGGPELWHEAIRNTALIAALVVPFTLAALLADDTVMRFLYQNKEFESLGHTLTVLIAAMSAGALGAAASIALATTEPSSDYHRHHGPNMRLNVLNFAGTHPTWIKKNRTLISSMAR
jgi:uncharacterized membrane protein